MSGLGFNTPISEQINRLNKSLKSRDERRQQQKRQRQLQADSEEGGWEHSEPRQSSVNKRTKSGARATGGITLGPASGRSAVPLPPPKIYNCQICNAVFHSEVLHQQHVNGPVHRKAVEKIEALKRNDPHARHSAAAEAALQAARWQSQGGHTSRFRTVKPVPPSAASNRQNANKNNSGSQGKVPGGPSHEEMVAELRSKNEPLNINGWIPPAVANPVTMEPTDTEASIVCGETLSEISADCVEEAISMSNTREQNGSESCGSLDTGKSPSPPPSSSEEEDEDEEDEENENDGNLLGLGGYDTDQDTGDSG